MALTESPTRPTGFIHDEMAEHRSRWEQERLAALTRAEQLEAEAGDLRKGAAMLEEMIGAAHKVAQSDERPKAMPSPGYIENMNVGSAR